MGTRNPSRVSLWEIATGKESIADIHKRGWMVRWSCPSCHTAVLVDLEAWAVQQPGGRLWNWHPRCRAMRGGWRCTGHVTFQVCAHGQMGWIDMISTSLMPGSLAMAQPADTLTGRPEPPLPAAPPAGPDLTPAIKDGPAT